MEDTIRAIIEEFGRELWLGFVILLITGFVMSLIKDFISDLVNYFKVRMSDIGPDVMIFWGSEVYKVREIKFKYIVVEDNQKKMRIPLSTWLGAVQTRPQTPLNAFDESQYKPWDGIDRRNKNEA